MFINYHNVKIVKCNLTRRLCICVFIMKYTYVYIIIINYIYIVHDRLNHF